MMGGGTEKSEADASWLLDAFDKLAVAFGIKLWPAAAINDELDAYMILGGFLREGEVWVDSVPSPFENGGDVSLAIMKRAQ